jgi:hypothetical protein
MQITGNPFVDVGFAIAGCKNGRDSLASVSSEDLRATVRELHDSITSLKEFKVLSAFWVNNPFMGKNLGQKHKFTAFLNAIEAGSLLTRRGNCQVCGRSPVIVQEIDRCWFPLAAGADSDPCTLPGLQGKRLCADCLAAIVALPLGCRSCQDGPYFVHVTEPDLQVGAAREGVDALDLALSANSAKTIRHTTQLRGRPALLDIASGNVLWDHTQDGHLARFPRAGATMISFSNNGTAVCFHQLHLPAQALEFLSAISQAGVRSTFTSWAGEINNRFKKEGALRAYWLDELCADIEERRSIAPLLFALARKRNTGRLQKEELKVLEIYEDVALQKKKRFESLQRLANSIRQMSPRYRDSFIKQLGNVGTRSTVFDLLKNFYKKRESRDLKITAGELQAIMDGPASETASLLYLLCVAEDEGGEK